MPGFDQFPDRVDYYSVLAHETTHWTSHASRCDRQLGERFGDDAYAMEELVAELGSAYTMARLELELTPREDHAQYIQSWLRVLRADKRAIFTRCIPSAESCGLARAAIGADCGGGGMTGRYLIYTPLESIRDERRFDAAWRRFTEVCRSLHRDGLDYSVQVNLMATNPHILITASGTAKPPRKSQGHIGCRCLHPYRYNVASNGHWRRRGSCLKIGNGERITLRTGCGTNPGIRNSPPWERSISEQSGSTGGNWNC